MTKDMQTLINRLREGQKGCEDKCLDLQTLRFEAKQSEMRLYDEYVTYWFKNDPKNPNDSRAVLRYIESLVNPGT